MHKMRYITRHEKSSSWIVRLFQGSTKETSKTFADKYYGRDEDKSLRAAQIWRDNRLEEVKPKRLHQQSITNKSGYIGIFREYREYPHFVYKGWRASYYQNGVQIHCSFSSKKYGECEAFRMACRELYKETGELRQILENPDVPCKPDVDVVKCYER